MMEKKLKTTSDLRKYLALSFSLLFIISHAQAISYDVQDVPEKTSGSLFSAEEFNNMMGVSRSWIRDDNNTFGNATTHAGEIFTDDTLTTQAKIKARSLQVDG